MTLQEYVDDIKLTLTGGVLRLEMSDENIGKLVVKAFQEVQRYIDETRFIQVPFSSCIDLTDFKHSSITNVYRTKGTGVDTTSDQDALNDPMYFQMWASYGYGGTYNLNQYVLSYASFNTIQQMRNTQSTDLAFTEDKQGNKLYINVSIDKPNEVVIEYVPKFEDVDEIKSDYWIDILKRLAMAHVKVTLGYIRTRFVEQSGRTHTQDGEAMRQEGLQELENIRETLRSNTQLIYPVD